MQSASRPRLVLSCFLVAVLLIWSSVPGWCQSSAPPQSRPTIMEFSRERCPMCAEVEKTLAKVKAAYGNQIDIRIVHIEPDEKLFKRYQIAIVPTQIFFNAEGNEVFRHMGVMPYEDSVRILKGLKFIQ